MKPLHKILLEETPCILLENTMSASGNAAWLFTHPKAEIHIQTFSDISRGLDEIDLQRKKGRYLAGFINYEVAYALIDKLADLQEDSSNATLMHFYAFDQPQQYSFSEIDSALNNIAEHAPYIDKLSFSESKEEYLAQIEKIQQYILEGDTYQVNHTLRMNFELEGSKLGLYKALRERQRVEYSAYIRTPEKTILSLSPELFIEKKADTLTTRPMKGTSPRGSSTADDNRIKQAMSSDEKQLAENLMIVDLMRNDIGKLANIGSVRAEPLFEIQTFETLFQMISTIRGEVDKNVSFRTIASELFPCGSITGTPKIRTMQIINELESQPRGVYTGAIGYITPDNDFTFNVPIRTIEFTNDSNLGQLGIGGGIIHDSNAEDEWEECLLKAKFLTGMNDDFYLIETCRVVDQGKNILRLNAHLARLQASAKAFSIPFKQASILIKIEKHLAGINTTEDLKLRLTLNRQGDITLASDVIPEDENHKACIAVSEKRIVAESLFRQHKTSRRQLYNDEFRHFEERGFYDVVFLNQYDRIAEASRHNLYIERDGVLYTPPLVDGALGGVYRQSLFDEEVQSIKEKELTITDLENADKILLSNSVRGLKEVRLA